MRINLSKKGVAMFSIIPDPFQKKVRAFLTNSMKPFVLFLSCLLLFVGCTKKIYDVVYPTLSDGRYDTEFPYRNCSKQLEEISRSVKRLNTITYYKSYVFSERDRLKESELNDRIIKKKAIKNIFFNKTGSGTATVIYHDHAKIAFLTCAHVIDTPDTILTFFPVNDNGEEKIVQSVSIKVRQQYYVVDIPRGGELELLKMDSKDDIAVLGKEIGQIERFVPVFGYPGGKSSDLEWGSFVYIIGYPIGYKMITRGIVSNPNMDAKGSFLIDALFNRGFSGGIILAIKDGVPNFELVGITKSVSARNEYVLRPEKEVGEFAYDSNVPYQGDY